MKRSANVVAITATLTIYVFGALTDMHGTSAVSSVTAAPSR